jgi:hypothetical protein
MAIVVFLEQREGECKKTSFEAVAEARRLADAGLGGDVIAVVACAPGHEAGAAQAGAYGADQVWAATSPGFATYQPEGYAAALVAAQQKANAALVLLTAGALGKDLAPRVAAKLGADCVRLHATGPVGRQAGRDPAGVRGQGDPAGRLQVAGRDGDAAPEGVPADRASRGRERPRDRARVPGGRGEAHRHQDLGRDRRSGRPDRGRRDRLRRAGAQGPGTFRA